MEKAIKRQLNKRTQQQKLELIVEWEKSGLPIKKFCEQHDFSDSLFHTWLNKYRRNKGDAKQDHAFVPLGIPSGASYVASSGPSLFAEMVTSKGHQIKFYHPISIDFLRNLLF